jgi:hypothetical protein
MAFFKLTMLGSQDPLKESQIEDTDQTNNLQAQTKSSQQVLNYGAGPLGSHSKRKEILVKHTRNPKGTFV